MLDTIDSRVRLAGMLLMSLPVAVSQTIATSCTALVLSALLLMLSGLKPGNMSRHLLRANAFLMFIWIVLPFTAPGKQLISVGPVSISMEGCMIALLATLKSNAIIMMFIALVSTIPVPELGWAMQQLRVPEKFCLIMIFAYHHIFIIGREYNRLAIAARVRCFTPSTNLRTYRTYAYFAAMTIIRSWNRAEKIRKAMILRGFDNRFFRLDERKIGMADKVFLAACVVATISFSLLSM